MHLDDGTSITAAELLVAVGRTPSGRGFGLEDIGVDVDQRGAVVVDDTMATRVDGIWAVGDVTGGLQFTHAAGRMGWVAAANALSRSAKVRAFRFDPTNVPWATFTSPEVGRVGLTEAEAAAAHPKARVAHLPLEHVDRAVATGAEAGFVKLIAAPKRVVGHRRRRSPRRRHRRRPDRWRPRPRGGAGDADQHVRRSPRADHPRLPDVGDGDTAGGAAVLRPVEPGSRPDRSNVNPPPRHEPRDMNRLTPTLLAAAAGYLAGSIPSADIATRLARTKVGDLRAAGSGNPGALNAAAVLGRRWGFAVLGADMAKGAAAGVIGRAIAGPSGAYAAATASIAGHIVPVWSGGRGGKGVATSAGACAAVFPAYFPIDAAVAATAAVTARNAERTIWISSAAWVAAAVVWWRRGLLERMGAERHRRAPTVRHRRRDHDPGQVPRRENPGMITIVTDSASMLPASLRTRYSIAVVPITITIDGREYADGVDLAIGEFYERLTGGAVVTTAAPSPGAFVDVYRSAASTGAEAVLSVHTGAAYSATVASATVAAGLVDIPVTIVDTEVASFPVALAIWSAADALTRGAPCGRCARRQRDRPSIGQPLRRRCPRGRSTRRTLRRRPR